MSESAGANVQIALEDITQKFAPERFSIPRLPLKIGRVETNRFGTNLPSCLDMLVYVPGGAISLPDVYTADAAVMEAVTMAVDHENMLMPTWRETHYVYLTVDQRMLTAGRTHRNGGWHFDGMQGVRYPDKLEVCHQYVVSDNNPTEFSNVVVDATHLDEATDNWFIELGKQVPDDAELFVPETYDLMMMTAYQLHRSPVARPEHEGQRTFIRMDFTKKKFDRIGNTINPTLPAPFEFYPRPMPFEINPEAKQSDWKGASQFKS